MRRTESMICGVVVLFVACGPAGGDEDGSGTTSTTMVDSATGDETGGETTATGEDSGDETADTGDETSETGDPGTCIESSPQECDSPSPYQGPGECDPFAQDCPEGSRCLPISPSGQPSWTATECSPLDASPGQIGDDCTASGGHGPGRTDTCGVGLICWYLDNWSGRCIDMCGCGPAATTCATAGAACTVWNGGAVPVCLPACDPLDPTTCEGNATCVFSEDVANFQCTNQSAGSEGSHGAPCAALNECDHGFACVPGGECDAAACCTQYCGVDAPDCPEDLPCTALYSRDDGECLANVGLCTPP